jgi:hypothetical protein
MCGRKVEDNDRGEKKENWNTKTHGEETKASGKEMHGGRVI